MQPGYVRLGDGVVPHVVITAENVAFTLNSLKSTHIVLAVVVNISKALCYITKESSVPLYIHA